MRLGYFTMPVHPIHRTWAETLKEDREAIILADQLGFYDAFMGEHLTDKAENITNSMIFNASVISDTKQIKLATGTSNLSHMHPVLVAQHAAMFDHLSEGRFIFGVSPGALTSDAEALGILEQDRNKMFAEAIDVILAIWEREPPYDIDFPDNRYKVSTSRTQALDIAQEDATVNEVDDNKAIVIRIACAVGAMSVALGGLDAIAFSGGVGEGSALVRARVCDRLGFLGVARTTSATTLPRAMPRSRAISAVRVAVVHAREDVVAARAVRGLGASAEVARASDRSRPTSPG